MPVEDVYVTRQIQRELCRRYVDMTRVDVKVMHGVCYLTGVMGKLRTHPQVDLVQEAELIRKILRQRPGIRDVVWDVQFRQH